LIEDSIVFGDTFQTFKSVKIPIGCTTSENKLFYDQDVDGIMGLGPGPCKLYKIYLFKL
jgi:hypothetical protein